MNSTLTLIYGSPVLPERNFKVPSLNDIISTAEDYTTITNFQYIKHAMDLTIKVDMAQYQLDFQKSKYLNLNYVIIQNDTPKDAIPTKKVGYFVIDKRWVAEETIELTLHCDVVNTFVDDCELSNKTRILRQHKNRFRIDKSSRYYSVDDLHQPPFSYISDEATWELDEEYELQENEVGVALYDLSIHDTPKYDGGTESCDIEVFIDAIYCECFYVDEDFHVIGEAFSGYHNISSSRFYILYNASDEPIQLKRVGFEATFIPVGAKYLAFKVYWTEDGSNAQIYFKPKGYDDLTASQQLELQTSFASIEYIQDQGSWVEPSITHEEKYYPIIDRYSEGIQPELFGSRNTLIEEDTKELQKDWYLVYMNQNTPNPNDANDSLVNPVDVFLCGSNETLVASPSASTTTWSYDETLATLLAMNGCANIKEFNEKWGVNMPTYSGEMLGNKLYIHICDHIRVYGTKSFDDKADIDYNLSSNEYFAIITLLPSSIFEGTEAGLIDVSIVNAFGGVVNSNIYGGDMSIVFTNVSRATQGYYTGGIYQLGIGWRNVSYMTTMDLPVSDVFATWGTTNTIKGIDTLDRTDSKIIKVLMLPYCPANSHMGVFSGGLRPLIFDSDWSYNAGKKMMKLNSYSTKLNRYLENYSHNPLAPLKPRDLYDEDQHKNVFAFDLKNPTNEPKLYHSDFYYEKFFYDSFGFVFQLELVSEWNNDYFPIIYYVSNTTMSRFMFAFPSYNCFGKQTRDYNQILYIGRNNEVAIFNQQYINYLRTSYLYDRKSLSLTEEQISKNEMLGLLGQTSGFVGSAYSTATSSTTASQYGSFAFKGANFTTSALSTIMNNAYSIQQKELGFSAKQKQLQWQTTGIIDANDVDMLQAYSRNRLAWKIYECSPKMKQVLFDLFYYTGYVADIQGIPDTTSRIFFNFVQADVLFKKVPNLPQSYINELKKKYAEGITFLHKVKNSDNIDVIDFDQQYENWETIFFEE